MSVIHMTAGLRPVEARVELELELATEEIHSGLARYRNALKTALAVPGLLRTDEERAEFRLLIDGIEAFQARIQLHMGGAS